MENFERAANIIYNGPDKYIMVLKGATYLVYANRLFFHLKAD